MLKRILSILCVLAIAGLFPVSIYAYSFNFGEDVYLELKGDLTYTLRMRTEEPDPLLVDDSKGNSNFKQGDLVNNKLIGRMEIVLDAPYVTLYGKLEAFYDDVYTDDKLYDDNADLAVAKEYASGRADAQEYYLDFHTDSITLRVGKQIVEWGELAAPALALGVGVMNSYDLSRVAAAGYEVRDYKVPAKMAWLSWEATSNLSFEAIYSNEFEPDNVMPVVGTYGSFMDMMGQGGPDTMMGGLVDVNSKPPEDINQYGAAVRMVFPSLDNLEIGLFKAHYVSFMPIISLNTNTMLETNVIYPEIDMVGITVSQVILDWQTFCEFTYRPNDAAQITGSLGGVYGYDEVRTFNWGFGAFAMLSDFLSFTPWTVQFSPMLEIYGGNNLDYDESKNYLKPEQVMAFMAAFTFASSDIVDNTTMSYTLSISAPLHEEESSFYSLGNTLKARIGDNIELMLGYDIKGGDPKKSDLDQTPMSNASYPGYTPDRDALTVGFTWFFM